MNAEREPGPVSTEPGDVVRYRATMFYALFLWSSCLPSANSSTTLAQNAATSSGLRLVTSPWSTTTSSSTQLPPALRMSVLRVGYEVRVRPFTTSASTSIHGPWQITPTGLAWLKKECTKLTASSLPRSLSAPTVPPGTIRPSYSSAETSENVFSTVNVSPGLTSLFMVWASPVWTPTTSTVAPASSTAFFASSNSTCSLPTGARRIAIFLPCISLGTEMLLSIDLHVRDTRRQQRLNGRDGCSTKALQACYERVNISGPSDLSTKVSSALAPSSEGFQAKAWPSRISCCVPGVAMTSREA